MADNDKYEDEYQFADPDAVGSESAEYNSNEGDSTKPISEKPSSVKSFANNNTIIRNALIVVGVVIVIMVIYPLLRSVLSGGKKESITSHVTSERVVQNNTDVIVPVTPEPVIAPLPQTSVSNDHDNQITQKLSTLESNQEHIQNEFVSTNSQLSGISNNLNDMMTKITALNTTLALYAAKMQEQSRVIEQLTKQTEIMKIKQRPRAVSLKVTSPTLKYAIKAVIPGRAWLIASNGTTLTVREGTMIPRVGMVTLIDPRQGRVLTSSGLVIRFSQEDS